MNSPETISKFPTQLPSNRTELIEELNATEERYVRKKHALKGYRGWKNSVAQHWLDERAEIRRETQNFWIRVGVYVTTGGLLVTILSKLL